MRRLILVAGLTTLLASAASAQTLTFSGNACAGGGTGSDGLAPYFEAGFQLTFTGDAGSAYWCSGSPNYPGSAAIFINSASNGAATLSKIGGGTFSLTSIDLATVYGDFGAGSTLFTGNLFGGGSVSATQTWDAAVGHPIFKTDAFNSSWSNLVSVQFLQVTPYFQFDNVVLNGATSVVPEPATFGLMGIGLVGIMAFARRRRKI